MTRVSHALQDVRPVRRTRGDARDASASSDATTAVRRCFTRVHLGRLRTHVTGGCNAPVRPRITRASVAGTVVATLAFASLASVATRVSALSPIDPQNRPTPLAGVVNGEVPPQLLVHVAAGCIAARDAGPSLARIFAMAREAKVSLGAEECYRSLQEEIDLARQASQPGANAACVATVGTGSNGQPVGHSFHGWGKAVDLTDAGRSLTFASPGYAFMKRVAGSLGWNHPAFAEPGGSACPEPWHWEWVGDGGSLHADAVRGDAVALLPTADDHGYAVVSGLGGLATHGDAVAHGSALGITIAWVVTGAVPTPGHGGYWMVGSDGGVFAFGNARFFGSTGARPLAAPVNGIAATPSGNGYWLVAWDGGVFSFGDARFHGSTGAMALAAPVDGMAATPTGNGYWLVASDGGVFSFGDARFHGSMGAARLVSPVVGIAPTPTGDGYWLVASDGGVFSFGDARFFGSLGATGIASPVVAITATRTGHGYWLELADGEVFAFGDARWYGNG